jgi:hypothetical protein
VRPRQTPSEASGEKSAPQSQRVPGSFIVRLAPGQDVRKTAQEIAAEYGGNVAHVYDKVLGGFAFSGPDDAQARLQNDPRVRDVEPDHTFHTTDTVRPELTAIDAPTAWSLDPANQGANVWVAVLDTGANWDNPYLSTGLGLVDGSCVADSGFDYTGQGTRTAGNIVANGGDAIGVLPQGFVWSIKVFPVAARTRRRATSSAASTR